MKRVEVLDCTFRDGGYMNAWRFPEEVVRDGYRASSKAGVDIVELGYHGTEEFFDPANYGLWRFSPESALRDATRGIRGANVAVMVDHGRYRVTDLPPAAESVADMIRLAAHRDHAQAAIADCEALREAGYVTSLQLMGFATYSDAERRSIQDMLRGAPIDYVYVADSYGSIFPDQVAGFLALLQELDGPKVGFHPHNHLQMAFANTIEAIRHGVDIVDGSIYGIGRAAGNLPLETIIAYLQVARPDRYNVLPLLKVIDRFFLPQQEETPWGYQLPYMLSGLFNVHPNYAERLIARHEYTIEDVWAAMQIVRTRAPSGFDPAVLEDMIDSGLIGSARPVVGVAGEVETDESGGDAGSSAIEPPAYRGRHEGRDFLVLGGGPTLASHRDQVAAFIETYDPIVLGANYLGGLVVPHYHAFNNKRRFRDYVSTVSPDARLLLGTNFDPDFVGDHTDREFEWLSFRNRADDFDIEDGIITTNCRTIGVLLCGVALAMGAHRVFIAGLDGYVGLDTAGQLHFYRETDEARDREILLDKHRSMYGYLEQINAYMERNRGEGLHILTPTGYARFYMGFSNYLEPARK